MSTPAVCLYFQVHQPLRLRRYSVFDADEHYWDDRTNAEVLRKVVNKCYLPATRLLHEQVERQGGRFRFGLSLTGVLIEQLRRWAPEALEAFRDLARTGCCELLAETYHHSLAFLYSRDEFREQVELHADLIDTEFGQSPAVFRNTELIYNNALAEWITAETPFIGTLAEGVDRVLDDRSPNHLYAPPEAPGLGLLLRNYRLSDDIAFRFSHRHGEDERLTASRFAANLAQSDGEVANVFMDFETFGEHQWKETGIFDFLERLPTTALGAGVRFLTPGEAVDSLDVADTYDPPSTTSWADTERDASAWLGNAMQSSASRSLYALEAAVKESDDPQLLDDWRRLTVSDHFYYMSTKHLSDGAVHEYFTPYESPYDAYINYMNVLDHIRLRAGVAKDDAG